MELVERGAAALESCLLCKLSIGSHGVVDEKGAFCCHGCRAVYNILTVRGVLEGFSDHPLFEEALRSGLLSNPELIEKLRGKREGFQETVKYYFEVEEMWCPSCAEVIKLLLLQERGVVNCVVDYATDLASVEYSPRAISREEIDQKIASFGYRAAPLQGEEGRSINRPLFLRFILSAFCSLNIMMFSYPLYANYFFNDETGYSRLLAELSFLASLPVVTLCLFPVLRRFINGCFVGFFGMEALVLTGVFSAFFLSLYELYRGGTHVYFDSMSVIVTLVLLGKIIEARAKFSSKEALLRLAKATPKRARKRFEGGEERFVSVKEISSGDRVRVVTGEKIVLDGVVVEGEGACVESLMTGEALPKRKRRGDTLLGGTLLQSGSLLYEVAGGVEETALQKILDAVNFDIENKGVYIRAADAVARVLTPLVFLLALLAGGFAYSFAAAGDELREAVIRFSSVLLISCPCAIGIAAPLAEASIMHALAKAGALVRNRAILPLLGRVTLYLFDKTGTITEGEFFVLGGLEKMEAEQRSLLKGLSSHSNHPIAVALSRAIGEKGSPFDEVREVAGMGMIGKAGERRLLFGSLKLLTSEGVALPCSTPQGAGETISYFYEEGREAIPLLLGDRIRSDAKEMVEALPPAKSFLLSGDLASVVEGVAKACGFGGFRGEVLPLEKREAVEAMKGRGEVVCMVGDGINDAAALAAADIGMSVVSATDISIQVSDIILTTDKLTAIPAIAEIGRRGKRVVAQNLFWAFFYNTIGIGLALFGYLTPIYAAFAMAASSVVVILNAKRIER